MPFSLFCVGRCQLYTTKTAQALAPKPSITQECLQPRKPSTSAGSVIETWAEPHHGQNQGRGFELGTASAEQYPASAHALEV